MRRWYYLVCYAYGHSTTNTFDGGAGGTKADTVMRFPSKQARDRNLGDDCEPINAKDKRLRRYKNGEWMRYEGRDCFFEVAT